MGKTRKVLDIRNCGKHIYCIFEEGKDKPYRVYSENYVWRAERNCHTLSKKQLAKYSCFMNVISFIRDYFEEIPEAWK